MVDSIAEKSPKQDTGRNAPEIEVASPLPMQAALQTEAGEEVALKSEKARRAQKQREEAALRDWKKLFEELFKINHPAQPVAAPREQDPQTKRFVRSLSAEYSFHANDSKVILHKERNDIIVEQKKIVFAPSVPQANEEEDFDLQSALVMARLASRNPLMIEKGIRLKGSEKEIALLRRAIAEVNEALPEGQQLRIADATIEKPAPQPAPINAFAQSAVPSHPVPGSGTSANGGKLSRVFSALRPVKAAEPVVTAKKDLVPVSEGEIVAVKSEKPEVKKAGLGVVGRVIGSLKPQPIAFNEGRRRAVTGAGAALAVGVLLQPETADAAGMYPRQRGFWENFFGVDFNGHHERRGTVKRKKRAGKRSKHESHKARAERRRREEDLRRKRAKEVKHEARTQKSERLKREKQAQQEQKNLEANKRKSLKQQKKEAQKQRDKTTPVGNGVILYNTHTGESLRLDFNSCGDASYCSKFNRFARDHYDPHGQSTNMAPKLQYYLRDIVIDLRRKGYEVNQINVHSGYRTVHTNVKVLKNYTGSRSQHCFGRALDISIKKVSPKAIRLSAARVGCDGIGEYGTFTHIDCRGKVARWFGKGVQPT